jgi:pilus assembly protein CpaC
VLKTKGWSQRVPSEFFVDDVTRKEHVECQPITPVWVFLLKPGVAIFERRLFGKCCQGQLSCQHLPRELCSLSRAYNTPQEPMGQIRPVQMQRLQLDAPASTDPSISGQVDAIHSPNVDRLLKPQYHLELEQRHSQLVMTNRNIRRIAVTDSTIANYVQYSPTEVSVVGMEMGETDLTFWFEDEEMPSIYQVSVVNDASLEDQRTIDFGRMERRLKTLFPNSQVAIIPVGTQVLVRGQAYDGEEAQNILQIVRAEVIRTLGRNNYNGQWQRFKCLRCRTGDSMGTFGGALGGGGGQNTGFRDIVINELSIPGEYNVMMRVIVAEINRSQMRNFGLDWEVGFNNSRHGVGWKSWSRCWFDI